MAEVRATEPAGRADERRDEARQRRALREQRSGDRARSEEYVAGQRDQRRHDRSVATKRGPKRTATSRKAARRVRRSAAAPITSSAVGAAGLFGVALSLVALYLALTSAETVAKVVQLVRGGLHWLASPKKSIPYGKEA